MTEQQAICEHNSAPTAVIGRALLISAAVITVLLLLLSVKYIVNDDPSFAMILSGSDGFPASADVPFISRLLSQVLVGLYSLAPNVPWYGIALYLSAWLGLALFVTIPLAGKLSRTTLLVLIAGWAPYLLFGLYNISMTNVTLWLQLGVFLHLLLWLRSDRCFRLGSGWLVAGVAVGYLWRWEMFLVFSVFAVPLLLFVTRKDLRKCVPILVGLCALVTVDRSWEFVATGEPEYRQYESFNRVRGRFHDRAEGQQHAGTPKALRQAGWSENDYLAYHELWMLYDEQAVSESRLREFLAANGNEVKGFGAKEVVRRLKNIFQGNRMVLPPFAFAALALLVLHLRGWWRATEGEWLRISVSLGLVLVGICAICYVRFVSRVSFPLFAYWLGLTAVIGTTGKRGESVIKRSRGPNLVAGILAVTGVALAANWARVDLSALRSEGQQRNLVQNSLDNFLKDTGGDNPLLIQLNPGVALMHVGCGPFRERLTDRPVRIVPSGWNIRSPRYRAALGQLKVVSGRELLEKASDDPSIYFVLYARPWDDVARVKRIWETYYREHFGGPAKGGYRLESVRRFGSGGHQLLFFQMNSVGN
jgi:hypothetical protein